ncbi:MAG TPA: 2-succinyl-5-enolpyruvyl-6-hydroxy-3-cyclohexene-1-carboxylic-acid synthase [Kofleriaceae bacterium]|nr:2-succinyl-5-enolpyruvyl-6-hydroxy-3-cyclohexene-1-carboxylic-acid synthase [Kofleriaceae bacterium]
MTAAVQTIWAQLVARTLADAGVTLAVISPGSRSTPLVAALAAEPRIARVTIIDERAAAFYALGAARATGQPAALVCTSGTAAAHYLPAIVEASLAGVPLIAITADRPPELHDCGASQTIDQQRLYGTFVREFVDLGAPCPGELAARAVRRKLVQAITAARGPAPGPVHVNVPLRKPLEPAQPETADDRALAALAWPPLAIAPPRLAPDAAAIRALAATLAAQPLGVIVAGAMPAGFAAAREAVFALARGTGYPIAAEAGSQLRFGPRPDGVVLLDHLDLIPLPQRPAPAIVLQLGAEPVAASWPAWLAAARPARFVLAGERWHDADSTAAQVILGDVELAIAALVPELALHELVRRERTAARVAWLATWRDLELGARQAARRALDAHPDAETATLAAVLDALPAGARLQIGNSLPIRSIDHVAPIERAHAVVTQRGAAGIDGLIASAAGATRAGEPVVLVLGDVSFAHDLGGLYAARAATAPLAIVVVDNGGGQIFSGLPVARASLGAAFDAHWLTAPELAPAAVATALGARGVTATSPAAVAAALDAALATTGVTVIHAPVSVSGAHDVRRTAIEFAAPPTDRAVLGGAP